MTVEPHVQLDRLLQEAGWLRALARSLVDAAQVDDVVQDTWVAALRTRPDPARPARPWLGRVLRNVASNLRREDHRRRRRESAIVAEPVGASPPELAQAAELQRRLAGAIERLPAPLRDVVVLAYFHGLDSRQLGQRLGISPSAVRTRHQLAIEHLRQALDAEAPSGRSGWLSATIAFLRAGEANGRRSGGLWFWAAGALVALTAASVVVHRALPNPAAAGGGTAVTHPSRAADGDPDAVAAAPALPTAVPARMDVPPLPAAQELPVPPAGAATIRGRLLVDGAPPDCSLHLRLLGEAEARAMAEPVEPGVARERVRPIHDVVLPVAARGEFRFEGLPAVFRGQLFVEGCAPVDGGMSVPIPAPGGELVVFLRAGPRLTGTVLVPPGAPAGVGGLCEVRTGRAGQPADRSMVVPFAVGEAGEFTVPVLAAGDWVSAILRVEIDGHCFLHHSTGPLEGGRRHALGVLEASPVRELELLVVDDAGQPLPSATVCIDGAGMACRSVPADARGVCRLSFLPLQPCVLLVQAPRHAERRIPSSTAASSLVALSPLATLTVQLLGERAGAVRRVRLCSDAPLLAGLPIAGRRSAAAVGPLRVHVEGDPPVRWQYVFEVPGGVLHCPDLVPGVAFVAEALDADDAVLARAPGIAGPTSTVLPLPIR